MKSFCGSLRRMGSFLCRLHRREAIASPQNLNDILPHPRPVSRHPRASPPPSWSQTRPHSGVRFAQVCGYAIARGDGVTTKKLKEFIRQPTPRFILPHPRYFNNKVLKLRFIVNRHFVFPYTNYTSA